MTPLQLRVVLGDEDDLLLQHIDTVNRFPRKSETDMRTLEVLWSRLEIVTRP